MESTLDVHIFDLRGEHFSCVHKTCENNIVFLRNVPDLASVRSKYKNCVAVEFVIFALESQLVADLYHVKNCLVFQMSI